MGHYVMISADFCETNTRVRQFSGEKKLLKMQGHHNTPFTIENILNGRVFKKSENGKIESEETYPGDRVRSVTGPGSPETDDVDVEGSDADSEVSCTPGSLASSDTDFDRVPRGTESGPDEQLMSKCQK